MNKVIGTEKLPIKSCACGCGNKISDKDKYGRNHTYISGHNNRKYKDPTQHKREWNYRNQKYRYAKKIERGHKLKVKIVKLMGSKCVGCNLKYNGKNGCVFQVHHRNPKQKKIAVNTRTLINYKWETILKEIKKCLLLCANCHFVKHNKKY